MLREILGDQARPRRFGRPRVQPATGRRRLERGHALREQPDDQPCQYVTGARGARILGAIYPA